VALEVLIPVAVHCDLDPRRAILYVRRSPVPENLAIVSNGPPLK